MTSANPRWIALQVMLRVLDKGRSLDEIFNSEWFRALPVSGRDLGLSRELAFGLCRWYFVLRELLEQRLQKSLRKRDQDVEVILMIGLYQLLVMQTEAHAAVNESVKLVHLQKKKWAAGLVNALWRGVLRDELTLAEDAGQRACPDWINERLARDWGEGSGEILHALSQRPPMTLRVDTSRITPENWIAELEASGASATRHPYVDSAVVLSSPSDVSQLPGFDDGLVSVQDASAQLAACLLPCTSAAQVLDACAAPGGKSLHLLQQYPGINLVALDSSETRLQRLQQNLQRGNKSARVIEGDAARPGEWSDGSAYDAILADVPCSASGVLRRHPDIKLLRRETDIMPLRRQQASILDALWSVLKCGGSMLYSTCSIFKEENESQIAEFLARHANACELPLPAADWGQARPHGRQILPGGDNMDGFYYALLGKRGDE